jgi:hypothetical protein
MVVFVIVLKLSINKNDRAREGAESGFWERERQANSTRRQDISSLDYITIPLDTFPLNLGTESEETIKELSGKRILNLTGISNTDLKITYGVANLEALTEYDDNFTRLVRALASYGNELLDLGQPSDAQTVLEYAVSIHADSRQIYTTLAELYRDSGQSGKIDTLLQSADGLESLSRDSIISALKTIQGRP